MDDPADCGDQDEGDDAVDEGGGGGVDKRHARCDERGGSGGLDGADPSRTQPFGVRGFLIKKGLRLISSMLRNGKAGEVVEAARRRGFIDDDMARANSSKPNQIADAIDNTLHQAGEFEEGIKEKLRVNLEPVVGQQPALGIAEALMIVFL